MNTLKLEAEATSSCKKGLQQEFNILQSLNKQLAEYQNGNIRSLWLKKERELYYKDCDIFRKFLLLSDAKHWLGKLPLEVWCHICTFLTPQDPLKLQNKFLFPGSLKEEKRIRKTIQAKRKALYHFMKTGNISIPYDLGKDLLSYCYFQKINGKFKSVLLDPNNVKKPLKLSSPSIKELLF